MKLTQEVDYTHAMNRREKPITRKQAAGIDKFLGESGLSLTVIDGEGRVNMSGLPMEIGDLILEKIRQLFSVHIRYNRNAYRHEHSEATREENAWRRDPHWGRRQREAQVIPEEISA